MNIDVAGWVRDPRTTDFSDITAAVPLGTPFEESNGTWTFMYNPEPSDFEQRRIKLRCMTDAEEEQLYVDAWTVIQHLKNTAGFVGTGTPDQLTAEVKFMSGVLAKLIPLVLTKFEGLY